LTTKLVKQVGKQVKQPYCLFCTSRNSLAAHMPCQAKKIALYLCFLEKQATSSTFTSCGRSTETILHYFLNIKLCC